MTNLFDYDILGYVNVARWSSGQDTSLSRWEHGFDSRTGHQRTKHSKRSAFFVLWRPTLHRTLHRIASRFGIGFANLTKGRSVLARELLGKFSSRSEPSRFSHCFLRSAKHSFFVLMLSFRRNRQRFTCLQRKLPPIRGGKGNLGT